MPSLRDPLSILHNIDFLDSGFPFIPEKTQQIFPVIEPITDTVLLAIIKDEMQLGRRPYVAGLLPILPARFLFAPLI